MPEFTLNEGVVRWEGGRVIGRILDVKVEDDHVTARCQIDDEDARDALGFEGFRARLLADA